MEPSIYTCSERTRASSFQGLIKMAPEIKVLGLIEGAGC